MAKKSRISLGLLLVLLAVLVLTGCSGVRRYDYDVLRAEYALLQKKYEELENRYEDLKKEAGIEETDYVQTKYTMGNYEVGVDIPAGVYFLVADGARGYFCLTPKDDSNDMIKSHVFMTTAIITIQNNEYLELDRCYAVPLEEAPEVTPIGGYLEEGIYLIGLHIPAGEYKIYSSTEGFDGSYSIYNNSRLDRSISSHSVHGERYIRVDDGQCLELKLARIKVE